MKKTIGVVCAVVTAYLVLPCTIALAVSGSAAEKGGLGEKLVLSSDKQTAYGQVIVDYGPKDEGDYDVTLKEEQSEEKDGKDGEDDIKIKVYFAKEETVREVYLEEYIKGVILGEIYASFEKDTLKAQAVAARSYTLNMLKNSGGGSHDNGAVICTDYTHCQSYKDPSELFTAYPEELAQEYFEKLESAVNETAGLVMTHEGEIVKAYYFDNSGGFTESSENVWGGELGYTQSVPCMGEADKDNFCTLSYFEAADFLARFQNANGNVEATEDTIFSTIKILSRTESNRINEIEVGGVAFKGTEMRSILGLKSTNVIFRELDDGRILAVTFGSGHGVGMSQWGAQSMAENGYNYEEILNYYYKDITVEHYSNVWNP